LPRPTFVVIGAAKCGTTTLHAALAAHPDVAMSVPKEPNFFSDESRYQLGWDWYESCFPDAQQARAIGEASVVYSQRHTYPDTAARIAADLPDARLVYVVRHPFDQVESHWAEWRKHEPQARPFNYVVGRGGFLKGASYWYQLSAFKEHFPDEQLKVVFLEDLLAAPDAVMAEIQCFIGVEPVDGLWLETGPRNVTKGSRVPRKLPAWVPQAFKSHAVRDRLPGLLGRALVRANTRSLPPISWDPATERTAQRTLQPDVTALLAATGKPAGYWRLSADPAQRHPQPASPAP
jgi:hypothetical protein